MDNLKKGWGGQNPIMKFRNAYLRAIVKSWSDNIFKKQLLKAKDVQEFLVNEKYISDVIWQRIDVRLKDETPPLASYSPERGWIGEFDKFIIHLPSVPDGDIGEKLKALTAYYQIFPTMFGSNNKTKRSLPLEMGVSENEFLKFGAITLRALAWTWDKEERHRRILEDEDANEILGILFQYNSTWNFKLKFVEDTDAHWDSEKETWRYLKDNIVELIYPGLDEQPYRQHAFHALTEYNNNGPEYPFTCT